MQLITSCTLGCSSELLSTEIELAEGFLRVCSSCGQLVSNCSREDYENALKKWDTEIGTAPNSHEQARFAKISRRILDNAVRLLDNRDQPLKYLDVGCSSGDRLPVAANMGFAVSGVEPAPEAAKTAQKAGFEVFQGFLDEANYPSLSFDVITLFEILEHLEKPVDMLRECRRILRPGGIIVLSTPNASSWTAGFMKARWDVFSLTKMGGHISFFSPKSVACLVRTTGFTVEKIETKTVRFYEKEHCGPVLYRSAKLLGELLGYPVKWMGVGHSMLVYLKAE